MQKTERVIAEKSAAYIDWSKVEELLRAATVAPQADAPALAQKRRHAFPGAVLLVGQGGEVLYNSAFGCRSILPSVSEMQCHAVFDIASLTKPIVATTLVMQLVDRGLLTVDRRLSRIFQTFGTHGKERITIRHLLNHSSGYPATLPFHRLISKLDSGPRAGVMNSRGAVETVYQEIFRAKLENLPGKVSKYSDVGFVLLGNAIEVLTGNSALDKLAFANIFQTLKMSSSGFIELSSLKRRGLEVDTSMIVPTAECPWRQKILWGEVHDDNAWGMGGVAAHAGVFSNATDIHRFATTMLDSYHGRSNFLSRDVVRLFWKRDDEGPPKNTWALGWDTPTPGKSSSGQFFSPNSVGHLGYTGCSLWIDPEREIDVVLLTNRVHPSVDNNTIREFRPLLHDAVMEALGYSS